MRSKLRTALATTAAAALVLGSAGLAAADNIQTDVVVGGNDTIVAGGSATVSYRIQGTGSGVAGCDVSATAPATVTIVAPAGVSASPSSLSFTSCDVYKSVVFSSDTAGSYPVVVSASGGLAGADFNVNPAKFTLTVNPATPSDTTAPTSSVSGLTGEGAYTFGEWTNADVTLTFSGADDSEGSGLKEIRYTTDGSTPTASHGDIYDSASEPVISSDGVHTVKYVAVDNAGNVESPVNEVLVKLDKTAPVITETSTDGDAGLNGWWMSPVTVTYSASDGLSGFDAADDPHTFTQSTVTESAGLQLTSGTVTDRAGNTSNEVTSGPFDVDMTAPTVTCPEPAPTFVLNSSGQVTAAVSDEVSGPASASVSADADTSSIGSGSVQLTGEDTAGWSTTVSCSYSVVFDFDGFFRPVSNEGTNSVKAGSAVPIKFSLNGDQGLGVFATGFPKSFDVAMPPTDEDELNELLVVDTAGKSSLSYDATTDTYTYVWKTEKAWAGETRKLVVKLSDGTRHDLLFYFK